MENYAFSELELHQLEQAGTVQSFAPDEPICFEGDIANDLYIIRRGRVRVMFHSPNGAEITLSILERGKIFGESSFLTHSAHPTSVVAVNPVELIHCSIDLLLDCLRENCMLTKKLLQLCSNTMNQLSYLVHDLCFLNRYGRVASFLLRETQTENPGKGIAKDFLPYTHEEIGWCIGLDRATVTRVLASFKRQQLLETAYRSIRILDRAALARAASSGVLEQR